MNTLKWIFLVCLGLVAGLVLAFPALVVVGFIFLIIPGLILYAIPTVFVYLLTTFVIRAILPLRSEVIAHLVAFSLTLGLSAAIMHGYRVAELRRYEQAALPEIEPPQKLTLAGDIFVNWPKDAYCTEREIACDFLCTVILDTPGVTSVTKTNRVGSATFRLGPGNPGTLVMPEKPEEIWDILRIRTEDSDQRNLRAAWGLRFASGEELRRDQAIQAQDAEWTIDFVTKSKKGDPKIERMEIRDKDGTVLVRKSLVQHDVPATLFYFGFEFGSVHDVFANAEFTVGSSRFSNQPRSYSPENEVELLRFTNIRLPGAVPKDINDRIEKMVSKVLDNPNATDSELLVVPKWLESLPRNSKEDRNAIFARILLDERIADPGRELARVIPHDAVLTPLREGLAKRYLFADDPDSKKGWYIEKLVSLPDGTFEWPSDEERAILNEAVMGSGIAAYFIERMADQGPKVIPELLSLMEAAESQSTGRDIYFWEGIRNAFKRLGKEGALAAPRILAIIDRRPNDFFRRTEDHIDWIVTMRLMGVEEKDLQRMLDKFAPENVEGMKEVVNKELQEYLQKRNGRK